MNRDLAHTMLKAPPFFRNQVGVPGSDTPEGYRYYPDALTFYVDPGHGNTSDNNDGTDPNAPLTTIAQAITNAVTGRGDLIFIAPGNYNPTAAITVDKKDVRIIGQPIGGNPEQPENGVAIWPAASYTTGPMFIIEEPCTLAYLTIVTRNVVHGGTPATASASIAIDGDGGSENGGYCHFHHLRLVDWWGAAFGMWFYAGAANLVEHCYIEGFGAGIAFAPSPLNNPTNNEIRECRFIDCTNGIEHLAGGTPHNFLYKENVFIDYTDAIDSNNLAADGLIAGNWYETATDAATYDIAVVALQANGINLCGNRYSE